jgi:hypothetical protein
MLNKPVRIEKYGVEVWCNARMDLERADECLCLNCGLMNNGCKQAELLYQMCKTFNLALMVTRCPDWKEKEAQSEQGKE